MAPKLDFDPPKDIPDLAGRVVLVTGGTNGLGSQTVASLAAHNAAHIYFTGRSQSSADKVIAELKEKQPNAHITFFQCDLASLQSVKDAAKTLTDSLDRLDLVFANAGIMALPPTLTKDGYEIQFGTNHVGHALLIALLTPLLERTAQQASSPADVRIIWTTSQGYALHPRGGILFDKARTPQSDISPVAGGWVRYGQSKLANLLYARAYARHHPSITSVSIHPGVSATGLVTSRSFLDRAIVYSTCFYKMLTPEQCAWNQQWAATAPLGTGAKQVESGKYYEPIGVKTPLQRDAGNDELAEKLWDWTQKELEPWLV